MGTTRTKIVLKLSSLFLSLCLYNVETFGATINAINCSSSEVAKAIATAAVGDTVTVPAGSCTWTTEITITKGL